MIGIDLVNLDDPLLKPRNHRTLDLITHPDDRFPKHKNEFWYLWTAKEAVFKAHRALTNFDPKAIVIQLSSQGNHLNFRSEQFSGKVFTQEPIIYAIAAKNPEELVYQIYRQESNDESAEVRKRLVEFCKSEYDLDVSIISDSDGLPMLDYKNTPVSFTHHAGVLGFCVPAAFKRLH